MPNEVEPEDLMNNVLGKVSDVLLNGDGVVVPRSEDHYLAFMSPGIPLDEDDFHYAVEGFAGVSRRNVDEGDLAASTGPQDTGTGEADAALGGDALQKYQRAEAFHSMCDLVPDTSGIVDSGRINVWNPESRVSSVYAMALQQSQVFDVQTDEATKAKVDRWRSKLQTEEVRKNVLTDEDEIFVRESDLVKKYNEKLLAHLGAELEYNEARVSSMAGQDQAAIHRFATGAQQLQLKLRATLNDWSSNGFKGEYDQLTSAIQAVEDRSFTLLKQRYKEDFLRSVLTNPSSGANFLYTAPAPASFARSGSGWSNFYFNKGSFQSRHKFRSSTTGGHGGFTTGAFTGAGSGSVSRQRWEGKVDTETFEMRFQMCRVPIYRPWLHLDFIKSGFWRFAPNNGTAANTLISDGGNPPNGLMPALTTECIFIRDLVLHFGTSHSTFLRQRQSASGSGGVAIGPFWAGGSHSNNSDNRQHNSEWSASGIRIPGLQLLGFICHMLPKSPDPNPGITEWI